MIESIQLNHARGLITYQGSLEHQILSFASYHLCFKHHLSTQMTKTSRYLYPDARSPSRLLRLPDRL
jgi:hypothetical protein